MAKSVVINGVTYEGVPYVSIPTSDGKTKAKFVDTDNATAAAADIRAGKTAFIGGNEVTGTVAVNESADVQISGNNVTVAAGIYDSEVKKTVAAGTVTPKATVTGSVVGDTVSDYEIDATPSATVAAGYVSGDKNKTGTVVKKYVQVETKTATPTTAAQDITPTAGKLLSKVTVAAVNLEGTATEADVMKGKTFYVNGLTKKTGTATVPVVGQDTTTKALTIS